MIKWEISIKRFKDSIGYKYKVTRRIPNLYISETKIFRSKEEARRQMDEWLK